MLKFRITIFFVVPALFLAAPGLVLAQENVSGQVIGLTETIVFATALLVGILVLVALTKHDMSESHRTELFWGMVTPVVLTSLFVAASAVFLNVVSASKGPVHYHADLEIYDCGREIDLLDPTGYSNRLGTAMIHEHNDRRWHVEGNIYDYNQLTLGSFFTAIGGQAGRGEIILPTNDGLLQLANGRLCSGGDSQYEGREGWLQVYRYRTDGYKVIQEKLLDWPNYVLSPYKEVPPGDCIVVELSPEIRSQTTHICKSYARALLRGEYIADNFEYGY